MPIILAIEPDRHQASCLAAAVRRRVAAELILADTTERALDAIGDRVPDMVLVPALLAPQDDAALAAALRVIAAATHVRTLTIPVLSSGRATPAAHDGIMSRWRRAKTAPAPGGCEPDVFADQIAAYLKEAAAEREELEPVVEAIVEPLMAAAAPPVASDVVELDPVESFEAVEPLERAEPRAPFEPRESFDHREPIESSEPRESVEPLEPVFDLSDEIAALAAEPDEASAVEEFAGEPVGIYTMPALDEEEIVEAPVAAEAVASEESLAEIAVEEMAVEEIAATADVEPIAAFVSIEPIEVVAAAEPVAAEPITTPAAFAEFAAFEDDEPIPEPRVAVVAPMMLSMERLWPALEGVPIEMPSTERTEWSALVASLRQDIEQRAARPPQPAMKSGNRTQAPKKRQKPVQDEWGFFDPEQCGFSALLAKLDEITGEEARG